MTCRCFQDYEIRNVSKARLVKYFDVSPDGYVAKDEIRGIIRFNKHDLLNERFRTGFDSVDAGSSPA